MYEEPDRVCPRDASSASITASSKADWVTRCCVQSADVETDEAISTIDVEDVPQPARPKETISMKKLRKLKTFVQ